MRFQMCPAHAVNQSMKHIELKDSFDDQTYPRNQMFTLKSYMWYVKTSHEGCISEQAPMAHYLLVPGPQRLGLAEMPRPENTFAGGNYDKD